MTDQTTPADPTTQFDQPEHTDQQVSHPGLTSELRDQPDHGEETYRGSGRLTGKRAVVTGGDSGIGRAVALAFAREGADVLISYLPEEESDAEETCRLVEAAGRRGVRCPGDITDEQMCQTVIDTAVAELGGIDILVNNAAYQMAQSGIADITTEQFDRVMKTNLYAMFWLCKKAIPHLAPGSTIINTTSIQAVSPSYELLDYATTKAGIQNFTRALSGELAERGIRVNAVAPGPIWTPLIPATMPAERADEHGETVPLGRAGQPAEVAPAYVFFASQESSYTTGETLGSPAVCRSREVIPHPSDHAIGEAEVGAVTLLSDYLEDEADQIGAAIAPSAGVAITFAVAGAPTTVGASSALALTVDLAQYEIGTGPCLHALRSGQALYVADLGADTRWGSYGPRAAELGAACCVSIPVRVGDDVPAVVKAYGAEVDGLTQDQQQQIRQAALTVAGGIRLAQQLVLQARELDDRSRAMSSRHAIDLALGILMERNGSTSVEAFALLRRYSQNFNVKLRAAAQQIVVAAGDPPEDASAPFS